MKLDYIADRCGLSIRELTETIRVQLACGMGPFTKEELDDAVSVCEPESIRVKNLLLAVQRHCVPTRDIEELRKGLGLMGYRCCILMVHPVAEGRPIEVYNLDNLPAVEMEKVEALCRESIGK